MRTIAIYISGHCWDVYPILEIFTGGALICHRFRSEPIDDWVGLRVAKGPG